MCALLMLTMNHRDVLGSPVRRGSFTGTQLGGLGSSPPRGEGGGPMAANFNIGSGSPKDEVAIRCVALSICFDEVAIRCVALSICFAFF